MIEFILGIRIPLGTTSIPASARTASNSAANLPSRSRIMNRARQPASSSSMTRFFAACATQEAVGCAVAPRTRTWRLACSSTANTYIRVLVRVTVSRKSQASRASACERRKSAQVLEARSGVGSMPACFTISHTDIPRVFAEIEVVNQLARGVRLGSDCREHYERSVAASFDLNCNVSLVDSHVEAIAQGAKAICGFE